MLKRLRAWSSSCIDGCLSFLTIERNESAAGGGSLMASTLLLDDDEFDGLELASVDDAGSSVTCVTEPFFLVTR